MRRRTMKTLHTGGLGPIDNLRISHNASGMGANIRVLVT